MRKEYSAFINAPRRRLKAIRRYVTDLRRCDLKTGYFEQGFVREKYILDGIERLLAQERFKHLGDTINRGSPLPPNLDSVSALFVEIEQLEAEADRLEEEI